MGDFERLRQLEKQLADLKVRMPAHTVRPAMMMELEDLEEEIENLRARIPVGGEDDDEGSA